MLLKGNSEENGVVMCGVVVCAEELRFARLIARVMRCALDSAAVACVAEGGGGGYGAYGGADG